MYIIYIMHIIMYISDVHQYNTRQHFFLDIPVAKTNLWKMVICFKEAITWNPLTKLGLSCTLSEPVFSWRPKKIIMDIFFYRIQNFVISPILNF